MKGKKIVLGVSGGIAAYKAAELVRLLVKDGAQVKVAMTANATQFVRPLTFEALSGNGVIWDMWGQRGTAMAHISWGQESDLIIIAPATANFIAKMSHGLADDFLSSMILAATAKILVCPAMNDRMYLNPATQVNLARLKERGFRVMDPGQGQLACRTEGPGRLPEPEDILEESYTILSPHDLSGLKILVTAGPTIEPIDPVRYISNRSSGKMGYALAQAARRRGASVTLVSGPTNLGVPYGVEFRGVKTADEMRKAVLDEHPASDVVIKAAAVADYRPKESSANKIKKGAKTLTLELARNPDILAELGRSKTISGCFLVGFAAETENLLSNAKKKLKSKNLDMIVANDVSRGDSGFETDTNIVKIIHSDGHVEELPLMSKHDVADRILDRIKSLRGHPARS